MPHRLTLPTALCALVLAACGGGAATTTTVVAPTTTAAPATTTIAPATTTTSVLDGSVLPLALEEMPDTWVEAFFIPYGEPPDTLGVSLGGDGDGVWWGPEYGAQAPDGTWWFLDAANFRLAHFSETGEFLGDIPIPESLLVGGIYFQWSFPRVLEDGTFLASMLGHETTHFLRMRGGSVDSFVIPWEMTPRTDDGRRLYGFAFGEDSSQISVDPVAESAGDVEWFQTRDGRRYRISVSGAGPIVIELPDAEPATTIEFDFEAPEIGGPVYSLLEVVSGADGTLHIFALGFPERDESLQLAGYMVISPQGEMTTFEPIMNPFTLSDPGTPARLGVRPGTSDPWYMNIGTDGVRVYVRRDRE